MNFTTKKNVASVVGGALTIAVVGLIGWVNHAAPTPIITTHNTPAAHEAFQPSDRITITPAVLMTPAVGVESNSPYYYQPVASYKTRHWWKRNAPIVGGAAGGALVGGLIGGGPGVLIGGAAGGGGGYLYKRSRHHHDHYYKN